MCVQLCFSFRMAHVVHLRMFNVLLRVDCLFMFSQLYRNMNKSLKILHDFTDSVILDRREELLRNSSLLIAPSYGSSNDATKTDVGEKPKMAFIDILLQSNIDGQPLSNLDIREEVDTFMFEVIL